MAEDINKIKTAAKSANGGMYTGGGGAVDDAALQKLEEKIFTAMESQA